MEFETYIYRTKVQIGEREVGRLWTLRKDTQDEFIVKEVYEGNCYRLPDDLSGKIIVDIGANIGAFAAACVDRGAYVVWSYDPQVELATKLFPNRVVRTPAAIVGDGGPNHVYCSAPDKYYETTLTGGLNTFYPDPQRLAKALSISSVLKEILGDGEKTCPCSIWLKLDCEGSEYEILASDLPWDRIERIFGECHTLIDGKLSRDTAPIENGRFPIPPSFISLEVRLRNCGYSVEWEQNPDDKHLSLFWATYREGLFEKIVDRSLANKHDAGRLQMVRRPDGLKSGSIEDENVIQPESEHAAPYDDAVERFNQIVTDQAKETSEKIDQMINSVEDAERARLERSNWKPPIPKWNEKDGWINAPRGVKTVCVLTPFRNARRYLPLYFRQLTSLRDLLSQNNYYLRLVAAEGDSLDGTHDRIIELANEHNIPLTMVDTTHGHMKWGSVEDPVRMRVMSEVMNKALDEVKESDDIVVWIMSDLEWEAETILGLINDLIADSETPYNIGIHAPFVYADKNRNYFWDTWAYRAGEKRFSNTKPFHSWLEEGSFFLDSAGTCLVMLAEVARKAKASDNEAVSFCREVDRLGYRILFNGNREVFHAPKLSYSILWISDAVCISGFSRVAHSLFSLLSEAGFDLEIIAQNYHGTPHNFPYLIWPANVNGEDHSGTLRMQNLLWANRDKYDAIVVLDDPWNVPRITRGLANVSELIWKEEGNKNFTPPPVISWVTVDGKNVRGIDLVGTHVISVTEFGKIELGLSEQVTEITYDYAGWAEQISVVPFGVDSSIFALLDKLECRKLTCGDGKIVPYDSFIVGTVSNNQLRKNLHLVIESFSEWVHRYGRSDAYLYLCVGKESDTGYDVESLVRYYDLRSKVIVNRSALPDEILAKVYNSFDVFISLSNEGFGLCALEAMSCGIPSILTDWSGYSSWVPSDCAIKIPCSHTQLTAPLNSPAYVIGGVANKSKVVVALQKLYTFSEMRAKLSVKGRELAKGFSWKNAGDKLINVIERVIEREAIKGELSSKSGEIFDSAEPLNRQVCSDHMEPEPCQTCEAIKRCEVESSKPFVSEFPCTCGNFPLCEASCEYRLAQEGAHL